MRLTYLPLRNGAWESEPSSHSGKSVFCPLLAGACGQMPVFMPLICRYDIVDIVLALPMERHAGKKVFIRWSGVEVVLKWCVVKWKLGIQVFFVQNCRLFLIHDQIYKRQTKRITDFSFLCILFVNVWEQTPSMGVLYIFVNIADVSISVSISNWTFNRGKCFSMSGITICINSTVTYQ